MGKGYISLHREIKDHWLWDTEKDKKTPPPRTKIEAWIELLLDANHKACKVYKNGKLLQLERGQLAFGQDELAKRWRWSRTKVNSFLEMLQDDNMIEVDASTKGTIITIINYCKYQNTSNEQQENGEDTEEIQQKNNKKTSKKQQKDINETTEGQQKNTNNKENNVNNDNKENKRGNAPSISKASYGKVVELYNNTCVSLPKVAKVSDTRKRAIKIILSKYNLDDLKTAFEKAEQSDFLKGEKGWQASFDWLIKEGSLVKVIEGVYDNRGKNNLEVYKDDINYNEFEQLMRDKVEKYES